MRVACTSAACVIYFSPKLNIFVHELNFDQPFPSSLRLKSSAGKCEMQTPTTNTISFRCADIRIITKKMHAIFGWLMSGGLKSGV